ncbi:MAG: hypothetical protein AB7P24_14070 [Nitrospira sp.]
MGWSREVAGTMQTRLAHAMLIAAVAIVYAVVALPLPYLLVDHYSAVQAGDTNHSDVDIHAWLEWATGSSLSGSDLVLSSALLQSAILPIPSVLECAKLLVAVLYARGPPALV